MAVLESLPRKDEDYRNSSQGEMANLIKTKDWSKTIVGDSKTWPQSLRTTLSILLNSKFPMFLWWGPELICFYNDAYRPSLGIVGKHPGILGKPAKEAWPEIWDVIKPLIDQVLSGGESTWSEDQLIPIDRNGTLEDVYWTFSYSAVEDESGRPAGVFVTCTETTKKVVSLKELLEREDNLQFTLEAAELGTWDLNPVTNCFLGNERLKEWFGLTADQEIQLPLALNVITENDRPRVMAAIARALEYDSGGYYEIEYNITNPKTGVSRTVLAKGKVLFDDNKKAYRFSGTLQDITESILSKKAIMESEERFRNMAEGSGILIAVGNETSNAVYFSRAWEELTGRSMKELLDYGWSDLVHPDDRDRYVKTYLDAFNKRLPFSDGFRILNKEGSYRSLFAKGHPRFQNDGTFAGYISSCIDITEQVEIQKQLKDSEERLQLLADNISQLAWMTDHAGYIFWYNKRWYEYTGTNFEEMKGWGWNKVQHPDHLERVIRKWNQSLSVGESWEDTFPLRAKNGEYRWFLSKAVPLKDAEGKVIRWFGSNTDITEQKEDELRKNDFISMVSHELKTPLTSLKAVIQLTGMTAQKNDDKFTIETMEMADKQVKKMTRMINGFLNVSRLESGKIVLDTREFQLVELIAQVVTENRLSAGTHRFVFNPKEKVTILADYDKIENVISNLLNNAVKYSPTGTSIDISYQSTPDSVTIAVRDQGVGIAAGDIDKIFERYYRVASNKQVSGFGIGLYLSSEIVTRHHGKIWAQSEPGKGTTFFLTLPLGLENQAVVD